MSSGEKQPEESPAEAKNPAEPKRGTLVVTRQKLMASGLSAGVREQIFKTPSDFRLELTSDPPVLTTETELSPFTQDESLWAIRIPPQKESLSLTVRLVQTKTKIPHLTSKVVVDTASPEPEYRWVLDWQQTAPQPGVTPGSTPKVSPLQKWDGLRDENGRHWKTVTSIP